MTKMDAAAKIFMSLDNVFADAVNFHLRSTGYSVDRCSVRDENPETSVKMPWGDHYRQLSNDIMKRLIVKRAGVSTWMLVATENQSYVSSVMPLRNLLTAGFHWESYCRQIAEKHRQNRELLSSSSFLSGLLPEDRLSPVVVQVVYFGQESWKGPHCLQDLVDCPRELRQFMADCPTNVLSLKDLTEEELNQFAPGAMRAVAKCVRYAPDLKAVDRAISEDESFLDMPEEAYDVVRLATNVDLKKLQPVQSEEARTMNMRQLLKDYQDYYIKQGEVQGFKQGEVQGFKQGESENEQKTCQSLSDVSGGAGCPRRRY